MWRYILHAVACLEMQDVYTHPYLVAPACAIATGHEMSRDALAPRQMNGTPGEKHMSSLMREVLYGDNLELQV